MTDGNKAAIMSRQITLHRALLDALSLNEKDMEHPNEQVLIDFQGGQLDATEAEIVRTHLASCGECNDFILAIEAFSAPEEELPSVDSEEVVAGWRDLHGRLEEGSTGEDLEAASRPSQKEAIGDLARVPNPRSSWWVSPALGYGLAAALLFALFGVVSTKSRDAARLAELEAWRELEGEIISGFSLYPLEPWGATRGADEVPDVRGGDILMLFGDQLATADGLVLEIRDASGQVVQHVKNFSESNDGEILVRLPRFGLDPGPYELTIALAKSRESIAKYKIRVIELPP